MMLKLLFFGFFSCVNALSVCSSGNQYFNNVKITTFDNNPNKVMYMSKNNVDNVIFGWKLDQPPNEHKYYFDFKECLEEQNSCVFKWVPSFNKNDIRCMISVNIDSQNKKFNVYNILPNPYFIKSFDFFLMTKHINELKNQKEYNEYEFIFDNLTLDARLLRNKF